MTAQLKLAIQHITTNFHERQRAAVLHLLAEINAATPYSVPPLISTIEHLSLTVQHPPSPGD